MTDGFRASVSGYAVLYTVSAMRKIATGSVTAKESVNVSDCACAISSTQHSVCVSAKRTRGASFRTNTPCATLAASIALNARDENSLYVF